MELLRKIGELGRQHYEKVVLVLALVILAVAVLKLYSESEKQKEGLRQEVAGISRKAVQGIPTEDLSRNATLLKRLKDPPPLNLSGQHNLFSPVRWQTNVLDGKAVRVRSGKDVGPERLEVVNIKPLELIVAFDRAVGNGYYLNVTNQTADPRIPSQYRRSYFLKLNETNRNAPIIIREVKGPEENPTGWTVEFRDTGDRAAVEPGKPAARILDYEADLKYPLEEKTFSDVRVGSMVRFAAENYKVIAITQNEVVIEASNGRQHRRPFNAVPGS
jgi:hypothetical protein